MTADKKEFAEMLRLFDKSENDAIAHDRKVALQFVLRGASIPKTLLYKIENYNRMME